MNSNAFEDSSFSTASAPGLTARSGNLFTVSLIGRRKPEGRSAYTGIPKQFRGKDPADYAGECLALGEAYYFGLGKEQSCADAARWFREAAEEGNADAETYLAEMYYLGLGVSQDYAEAAAWCRKAAEQGDACAEGYLTEMYYRGHGVRQDYAEAARWCLKAVEQGNEDVRSEEHTLNSSH